MIDSVDKKILNMLMQSGRVSYTDIAKAVDMKPPSVIDRIKKLESEGIIKGYTADIDYQKLGYDIFAFIGLTVDNASQVEQLETGIKEIEGIIGCYHVTGDFSLIVKLITESTNSLADIIKKLRAIEGVAKTNTILIFSTMLERRRSI
ncbi:MAG: Lrp/AsnC family transcriptional regulator [Deferribacteraceae bacterium]|jgi:Lrp/AsnC family leucine-responsive transcriptional regulator|nr:Lrp/AsnC family transcriptional regulator [Deferribacteraceae bacterium]